MVREFARQGLRVNMWGERHSRAARRQGRGRFGPMNLITTIPIRILDLLS
jgi:hypothetical protein